MDELASKLTAVSFCGDWPISIEKEDADDFQMNDAFMKELIEHLHCSANKLAVLDRMKEK